MSKKPSVVRARDAASLVVYRGDGQRRPIEVVMGRRRSQSSFMPDVYVFPGGAVDRADARVQPATTLPDGMAVPMAVANSTARARTIAMAAVRETFEETGMMLALPGQVATRRAPTSWQCFHDRDRAPNLSVLHYLGRALTPSHRPIRFHARFFAVHAQHLSGPPTSGEELLDVGWYPTDPYLLRERQIKLMGVTESFLREITVVVTSGRDASTHVGELYYSGRGDKRIARGSIDN